MDDGRAKLELESEEHFDAFDWLQCVMLVVVLGVLFLSFIGRSVQVYGPSMERTLIEGDRLIVSNMGYTPRRGDIIVLRQADSQFDYPIIKRIIATEGETVDIDFEAGVVYVDDEPLDEPYVSEPAGEGARDDFKKAVTVPDGCVFVLGDNRNRSTDSRNASVGCVDIRCIIGRALFRLTPFSRFGSIYRYY